MAIVLSRSFGVKLMADVDVLAQLKVCRLEDVSHLLREDVEDEEAEWKQDRD